MQPADLELYSTQELIHELVRRQTFLGVIIQSEEECKDRNWGPERVFQVHYNSNLTALEASRLLDVVAEYIDLHHSDAA